MEAKQNSLQRIRLNEKLRMRNKARKSAIATRMKKVGLIVVVRSERGLLPLQPVMLLSCT